MSYQLPPLSDEYHFEKLVRDILRRVYNDPGIERFGRKGQSQYGIDGFSPSQSGVTFQCKLKDTRYKTDDSLCEKLSSEMKAELEKTQKLNDLPNHFIFASTFKNDTHLQQKAQQLSSSSLTVEYWGWDTINEKLWDFAEELLPEYYPHCPVRKVLGFRQIRLKDINDAQIEDEKELKQLALDYYRINDRDDVMFKIVCNKMDVRNDNVMNEILAEIEKLPYLSTLWIVGNGGCGKTTILNRLAIELIKENTHVFILNLEAHLTQRDIEHILALIRYNSGTGECFLCVDNPAADEEALTLILRRIPQTSQQIKILLTERGHRYQSMRQSGGLTFIHGEEERNPIVVRNSRSQRQLVYNRLFDLLGLSENITNDLLEIALNDKIVYVNATYNILLELRKKRQIDFDFDWDDYRRIAESIPVFLYSYRYIALFYLMGVKAPFDVLARICGADNAQKRTFLSKFGSLQHEPIVITEWRDEFYQKQVLLRTKHEIISDIYFHEHPEIDKNELMIEWCENTYFNNSLESQALVNIFGAKKNYFADESTIDYEYLVDFLLSESISEKVQQSKKLYETLHLARFWIFISQGREADAIKLLLIALKLMPDNLHYRTELAKIYQHQGKHDEAEKILMDLIGLDNKNLQARTELAKIYQHQGKHDEAEVHLKKCLEIKKNDISSRTELAKVYQLKKEYLKAELELKKCIEINPSDLNSRTELSKVYQQLKYFNEAEKVLIDLLNLDPNSIYARTELAKVYKRLHSYSQAEKYLIDCINIKPNDRKSRTELAKIYQLQGKYDEAENVLLKILTIRRYDCYAMAELISVYTHLKQKEICINRFDDFMKRCDLRKKRKREPQPMFNNFFKFCRNFNESKLAKQYFVKYKNFLDDRNISLYHRYFGF
jgi:tetratricopeptide (TPR) repeat protein